jgi:uncharacterized membrane protein
MEPALLFTAIALVAAVFGWSGYAKLAGLETFQADLAAYQLVPPWAITPLSWFFPVVEIGLALAVLIPATRTEASWGLIALTLVFSAAVAINLLRGRRELDCGCFGGLSQHIGPQTLLRNAILLAGLTLIALVPPARAALSLDLITGFSAGLALVLLYFARLSLPRWQ